jgi:hypothetical protein
VVLGIFVKPPPPPSAADPLTSRPAIMLPGLVADTMAFSPRACCPSLVTTPTSRSIAPSTPIYDTSIDLADASAVQLAAVQEDTELAIFTFGPPLCASLLELCCTVLTPPWMRFVLGITGIWFLLICIFDDQLIRKPVEVLRSLSRSLDDLRGSMATAIVGGALRAANAPHAAAVTLSVQEKYGQEWLVLQARQGLPVKRRLVW